MLTSRWFSVAGSGRRLRICLFGLLLGLFGCTPALKDPISAPLRFPDLPAEAVAEKIATTTRGLEQAVEPALQAELLLTLGLLYTHPDNSAPDYARALQCLRQYAEHDPQAAASDPIRRLTVLLAAVTAKTDQLTQLAAENSRLAAEGHALDQKIKELERSNRDMKAVIEKLKNLDIRLERRRNRLE
jgi:hypothetical protein